MRRKNGKNIAIDNNIVVSELNNANMDSRSATNITVKLWTLHKQKLCNCSRKFNKKKKKLQIHTDSILQISILHILKYYENIFKI